MKVEFETFEEFASIPSRICPVCYGDVKTSPDKWVELVSRETLERGLYVCIQCSKHLKTTDDKEEQ